MERPVGGQAAYMSTKPRVSRGAYSRLLPDAQFIRREVPIAEVARRLGLKGNGRYFSCWREDHPKGDGRATVGVHFKSNTVRCSGCDKRSLSPIDLVREVLQISVGDACRWFAREYPDLPKVRLKVSTNTHGVTHQTYREDASRAWPEVNCDVLTRSPVWPRLSHAGRTLAAAIVARVPREHDVQPLLTCSYEELQWWTGIGNRRTVARALRELREIGMVVTGLAPTGRETRYGYATRQTLLRLTWWSRRFQQLLTVAPSRRTAVAGRDTATGYTVAQLPPCSQSENSVSLTSWKPKKEALVQ